MVKTFKQFIILREMQFSHTLEELKNDLLQWFINSKLPNTIDDISDVKKKIENAEKPRTLNIVARRIFEYLEQNNHNEIKDFTKLYNSIKMLRNRTENDVIDTFGLSYPEGDHFQSPSNPNFRKKLPGTRYQYNLIRLYNWAKKELENDKIGSHIIKNLEKDIYDKITWFALLDRYEELNGKLNSGRLKTKIKELFDLMEEDPILQNYINHNL